MVWVTLVEFGSEASWKQWDVINIVDKEPLGEEALP